MSDRNVDGRTDLAFNLDPADAASSEAVQGPPLDLGKLAPTATCDPAPPRLRKLPNPPEQHVDL